MINPIPNHAKASRFVLLDPRRRDFGVLLAQREFHPRKQSAEAHAHCEQNAIVRKKILQMMIGLEVRFIVGSVDGRESGGCECAVAGDLHVCLSFVVEMMMRRQYVGFLNASS